MSCIVCHVSCVVCCIDVGEWVNKFSMVVCTRTVCMWRWTAQCTMHTTHSDNFPFQFDHFITYIRIKFIREQLHWSFHCDFYISMHSLNFTIIRLDTEFSSSLFSSLFPLHFFHRFVFYRFFFFRWNDFICRMCGTSVLRVGRMYTLVLPSYHIRTSMYDVRV